MINTKVTTYGRDNGTMKPAPESELYSAFLDGELTPAEQERIERLLERDAEAATLVDSLRSVRDAIQSLPTQPIPVDLTARVLSEARRRTESTETQDENPPVVVRRKLLKNNRLRRNLILAFFAVPLIGILLPLGWSIWNTSRRTSVDNNYGEIVVAHSNATRSEPRGEYQSRSVLRNGLTPSTNVPMVTETPPELTNSETEEASPEDYSEESTMVEGLTRTEESRAETTVAGAMISREVDTSQVTESQEVTTEDRMDTTLESEANSPQGTTASSWGDMTEEAKAAKLGGFSRVTNQMVVPIESAESNASTAPVDSVPPASFAPPIAPAASAVSEPANTPTALVDSTSSIDLANSGIASKSTSSASDPIYREYSHSRSFAVEKSAIPSKPTSSTTPENDVHAPKSLAYSATDSKRERGEVEETPMGRSRVCGMGTSGGMGRMGMMGGGMDANMGGRGGLGGVSGEESERDCTESPMAPLRGRPIMPPAMEDSDPDAMGVMTTEETSLAIESEPVMENTTPPDTDSDDASTETIESTPTIETTVAGTRDHTQNTENIEDVAFPVEFVVLVRGPAVQKALDATVDSEHNSLEQNQLRNIPNLFTKQATRYELVSRRWMATWWSRFSTPIVWQYETVREPSNQTVNDSSNPTVHETPRWRKLSETTSFTKSNDSSPNVLLIVQ